MSDALCGPSNSLQQLKHHSQVDRTLQQDRLASRPSPTQGFRSFNPNDGQLDSAFEAFQAGVTAPGLPPPPTFQEQHLGPVPGPSWATDFQQMHISSPPASFNQMRASTVAPPATMWARHFREHQSHAPQPRLSSISSPQQFQHMARFGGFAPPQPSLMQTSPASGISAVERYDEFAFERAFEQASQQVQGNQTPAVFTLGEDTKTLAHEQNSANATGAQEEVQAHAQPAGDNMVGLENQADLENPQVSYTPQDRQSDTTLPEEQHHNEDDALAATAHDLLQKVEHEKSDKFAHSQFLGLMRRLRDREVRVQGDQMVETADKVRELPHFPTSAASAYVSGTASPVSVAPALNVPLPQEPDHLLSLRSSPRSPSPEFDTHFELGRRQLDVDERHMFDHWESPCD